MVVVCNENWHNSEAREPTQSPESCHGTQCADICNNGSAITCLRTCIQTCLHTRLQMCLQTCLQVVFETCALSHMLRNEVDTFERHVCRHFCAHLCCECLRIVSANRVPGSAIAGKLPGMVAVVHRSALNAFPLKHVIMHMHAWRLLTRVLTQLTRVLDTCLH